MFNHRQDRQDKIIQQYTSSIIQISENINGKLLQVEQLTEGP